MKLSIAVPEKSDSLALAHLRPATRTWFDEICGAFELESHHLKILQLAAEAWDGYQQAREAIAENGTTFINVKHGDIKPRPEVAIMQNSRIAFLRALRELNLDLPAPDAPRPAPLKYPRGSSHANSINTSRKQEGLKKYIVPLFERPTLKFLRYGEEFRPVADLIFGPSTSWPSRKSSKN